MLIHKTEHILNLMIALIPGEAIEDGGALCDELLHGCVELINPIVPRDIFDEFLINGDQILRHLINVVGHMHHLCGNIHKQNALLGIVLGFHGADHSVQKVQCVGLQSLMDELYQRCVGLHIMSDRERGKAAAVLRRGSAELIQRAQQFRPVDGLVEIVAHAGAQSNAQVLLHRGRGDNNQLRRGVERAQPSQIHLQLQNLRTKNQWFQQ